jgi:Na+/phosphate symporter
MNSAATVFAGLGLFFVGIRLIVTHVRALLTGTVRRMLSRAIGHRGMPQMAGLLLGALTQTTSAVTFLAAGLISAGAQYAQLENSDLVALGQAQQQQQQATGAAIASFAAALGKLAFA